ncbi:hypothetical protein BZG36_03078 [Bifiguratus adelaidae]|uniref:Methyltransferase domain-containing protein n=1 Tax=Bifiguratus adelaidae TaxID=1938954 RepID=A0A261XZG0_9FUNG|nr:hypothetical protein BZG36_03078 [Bifiguratus adelaidae]
MAKDKLGPEPVLQGSHNSSHFSIQRFQISLPSAFLVTCNSSVAGGLMEELLPQRRADEHLRAEILSSKAKEAAEPNRLDAPATSVASSDARPILSSPNGTFEDKPKFVWNEVNRRFHNIDNVAYVLPNDAGEMNRLQELQYLMRYGMDGDFHAPVRGLLESGAKVLDIGCGPGTWFPDNHFDFVYPRYLEAGFTSDNWTFILGEIKRVTKPGGWVQLVELDFTMRSAGPLLKDLSDALALKNRDLDITIGRRLASLVKQCSDDPKRTMKIDFRSIPVSFGGRIGAMWANQLRTGMVGIQPILGAKYGKMTPEEFKERLEMALEEGAEYQTFTNFYYGYVQVVKRT